MASRGGPRAAGTDGSDFSHRERVASRYKESVKQKAKIKFCLYVHLFLGACVVGWVVLAILRMVKMTPEPWMIGWLVSCIPALVGLSSIPKNRQNLMYVYTAGTIVTGIGPLMYGATVYTFEIMDNFTKGFAPGTQDWRSIPLKMAFVAFVIQIHAVSVYYANKLMSAWSAKGDKST